MFYEGLKSKLTDNEVVLRDKGCSGYQVINELDCDIQMGWKLLARHESANRKFKQFNVLSVLSRDDLSLHAYFFIRSLKLNI